MAKRKNSQSARIREALVATPDKPAAEIAQELSVKPGLVYNVKAKMKEQADRANGAPSPKPATKRRRKAGRKPGPKPGAKVAAPPAAHAALDTAFEFVVKVGGLLHAEQLLDKLKAMKEKL